MLPMPATVPSPDDDWSPQPATRRQRRGPREDKELRAAVLQATVDSFRNHSFEPDVEDILQRATLFELWVHTGENPFDE